MRLSLLALPLLAACATAPAPSPSEARALPREAWVDLRFGWQPGLAAEVETVHVRTAPGPGGQDLARVRVTSRLAVEAVPGGVAVRVRDLRHQGPAAPTPTGIELLAGELAAPDRIIGPAGNLVGVEARETARAEVGEALVALSRVGPVPGAFRDRILDRLEPASLRADAATEWDRLVGFWAGASLQPGRTYVARDLVPVDLLADLPVETEVRMRLVDFVPCAAGEAGARCVALELVLASDEAAAAGMGPFLARLFGETDRPPRLAYEERSLLVAEPEGLLPHRLSTVRRVTVAFGEGGADRYERSDERTVTFRYAAPTSDAAASPSAGTRSSSQHAASFR